MVLYLCYSAYMASRPFSFRVPLALYSDLKAHSRRIDRSIGWILARAAAEYLKRNTKEKS
jgi:predicted transcriptional regulator